MDAVCLKKEIWDRKAELEKTNNEDTSNNDSFFNNYIADFIDYFERQKSEKLFKRADYKELINKIHEIKIKYPKARAFIEDEEITPLTSEEMKAVLKIIEINNDIDILEVEEAFRLGLKEQSML